MKANILIIDDDQNKLDSLELILRSLDQNIIKCLSGAEGLRAILANEVAVILLDVNMPVMDGFETAKLIRNRVKTSGIPIIFITAYNTGELDVTKGYTLGAVDYIFYPFNEEFLLAKLKVFLEIYFLRKNEQVQAQNLAEINRNLIKEIKEHKQTEDNLRDAKENLELRVLERTEALQKSNNELIKVIEKAKESDRLKSAFLANISHEIRTPMNGILGFAELLKTHDLTGEKRQEYINIIESSGQRMLNIINDIIDISKIESGKIEVHITETNIHEEIEFLYNFFHIEAKKKGIQLNFRNLLPYKEAIIKTDKDKVYAILSNLIKNAIKFTNKGYIEYGCEKKGNKLEFFVKDSGVGIHREKMSLIFERFRQGSDSLARGYEGTGLGLSISKAFVEILGGNIWVESEEGKGSIFYFTIPYIVEQKSQKDLLNGFSKIRKANQNNDLNILIAEDEETIIKLIKIKIEPYSRNILIARNGLEAVKICRDNPDIDLILMDMKMPEMNGYEATKEIRKFNKEVIIIAQTAYAHAGDGEKAIETGCNDYISKPFSQDKLNALMQKYGF